MSFPRAFDGNPRRLLLAVIAISTLAVSLGAGSSAQAAGSSSAPPTFTVAPASTLAAPPVEGTSVTAVPGTWSPTPKSLTYQWRVDDVPVPGATQQSYSVAAGSKGHVLSVSVTAAAVDYGSQTRTSDDETILGAISHSSSAIAGLPKPGDAITATWGDLEPSDTTVVVQWQLDSQDIGGATEASYTPTESEQGHRLDAIVTLSHSGYQTSTVDEHVLVTHDVIETTPMTPIGDAAVGSTLTASSTSDWYPAPTTTRYQWLRDGISIDGAIGPTYLETMDDAGHSLSFTATGSHDEFPDASVTSSSTTAVLPPFDVAPVPVIHGTAQVGQLLTATTADWEPSYASYTYTWFVDGVAVPGSTQIVPNSYRPIGDDVGKSISVEVTAHEWDRAATTSPMSEATAPVLGSSYALGAVTITSVHLNATVNASLVAPPAGVELNYQWERSGKDIPGATASSYKPEGSDWHKTLRVRVTMSGTGFTSMSVTSNGELVHSGHMVRGSAQLRPGEDVHIGATLHAEGTGWPPGTKVHFVWQTPDMSVWDFRGPTHRVSTRDYPGKLWLWAWGEAPHLGNTKSQGMTGTSYTVHPAIFSKQPVPTISGTAQVGVKLTAHRGTWSPSGHVTYSYQWFAQANSSAAPVAIAHATHATFTPGESVSGDLITVRVTAHKHDYATTTKTSASTSAVAE